MILKEGTGLFKVRKPRSFNLVTRYYDADKERLMRRVKEIEQEKGKLAGDRVQREMNFRTKTDIKWKKNYVAKARMKSNIRLLVILGALTAVFIYLYNNIDAISTTFENLGR